MPRLDRVAEICDALGLEFYVGPPRTDSGDPRTDTGGTASKERVLPKASLRDMETGVRALSRVIVDVGGDPIPDDLWPVLAERRGFVAVSSDLADLDALATMAANDAGDVPGARPVGVFEAAAAAGGGTLLDDAPRKGRVWFRRDWLDRRGLDATQCVVIGVMGESMEPTLPDGCSILVDRTSDDWREGHLYVVQTEDGLIVKRAGVAEDGDWLLVSDHPAHPPVSFPADAVVVGEVRWAAQSFG